ncbi:MAG: pyridoxal-phosphate dependent enzyme, partial [Pseudomonadales bacterium]|nr:pyridoxal-phosphate dependent enzyme [Pseudomonadales bacterium]
MMRSDRFDTRVGAQVFFKCENLQRVGAFKFRGAYNAISRLSDDQRRRGVV